MVVSGFNITAPWRAPEPNWDEALSTWGILWHVHIYFFGSIFALAALYTVHRILQLIYGYKIKESSIELIILFFVLLFSLTRSIILLVDPYQQGTILTEAQPTRVLWGLGTPCYISINFFLIILLLKNCSFTCCGACSPKCQVTFIVVIVALQLGLFVVKNSITVTVLLLEQACQTWSVLAQLFFAFVLPVLCIVIKRKLLKSKGLEIKSWLVLLVLLTEFVVFIHCGTTVYNIYTIGLFDQRPEFIEPWKWMIIETAFRSSEMIWSVLIMLISSKKRRQCLSLETPDYDTYNFFKALVNYRNSESATSVVKSDGDSTSKSSSSDSTSGSSASDISRKSKEHKGRGDFDENDNTLHDKEQIDGQVVAIENTRTERGKLEDAIHESLQDVDGFNSQGSSSSDERGDDDVHHQGDDTNNRAQDYDRYVYHHDDDAHYYDDEDHYDDDDSYYDDRSYDKSGYYDDRSYDKRYYDDRSR